MRIPRVVPVALVVGLLAAFGVLGITASAAPKDKVTICHATSSRTNPYVEITVAPESIFKQGHDVHQDGRDIIPPFDYVDAKGVVQHYPGKNWDAEGQAWLANGCNAPDPGPGPEPDPDPAPETAVTICHRFGTDTWVLEQVTGSQALDVHDGHHPLDVIPPFRYEAAGGQSRSFTGQNWDAAGRALFANGCVPADPGPGPDPRDLDQPVGLSVSCVRVNGDGTYDAVFGYDNGNGHDVTVPAGDLNTVINEPGAPGAVDRGQPTTFGTASQASALVVRGISVDQTVTWRVVYRGTTEAVAGPRFPVACASDGPTPDTPPVPPPPDQPSPVQGRVGVYVACVTPNAAGTRYAATFGYVNLGSTQVTVPVGGANQVTGAGRADQGQPVEFMPGSHEVAFAVAGVPAARAVTWSVRAPGMDVVSATADITAPSCAVQTTDVNRPDLNTRVRAPRRTRVRTPTKFTVTTGNDWQEPAYDVQVDVPTPHTEDNPGSIVADGLTCPTAATGRTTTCTAAVILPGSRSRVRLTTFSRRTGTTFVTSRAKGVSVLGRRLAAVDSTPMEVVGTPVPVTG